MSVSVWPKQSYGSTHARVKRGKESHKQTHTHKHTHTHVDTHTYTYTRIYTQTQRERKRNTRVKTGKESHKETHTHTHTHPSSPNVLVGLVVVVVVPVPVMGAGNVGHKSHCVIDQASNYHDPCHHKNCAYPPSSPHSHIHAFHLMRH